MKWEFNDLSASVLVMQETRKRNFISLANVDGTRVGPLGNKSLQGLMILPKKRYLSLLREKQNSRQLGPGLFLSVAITLTLPIFNKSGNNNYIF